MWAIFLKGFLKNICSIRDMEKIFDVVVVGSGASGAMAAQTLIEKGCSVCMIDVGFDDSIYRDIIPDEPYSEIRKNFGNQKDFFLGFNNEGIPKGDIKVGAQLTPPRQFIEKGVEQYLGYSSNTFHPMQSLALGGLAGGWGAACFTFSDEELKQVGILDKEFRKYYDIVAKRIGISGDVSSDLAEFCLDGLENIQSPLRIDSNAESILNNYNNKRHKLNSLGLYVGKANLAVLTSELGDRKVNPYFDMDFWSDSRKSIYRPRYTIDELTKNKKFTYIKSNLVVSFHEKKKEKEVHVISYNLNNVKLITRGRFLMICAGAINSARLVLNSLNLSEYKTSLLSSPYTYMPVINMNMLGRKARDERHSLAQLAGILFDVNQSSDCLSLQFYSYRSLLLFKLIKEIPLPVQTSKPIVRLLLNALAVVGVFHPDSPCDSKWLKIGTSCKKRLPELIINYELTTLQKKEIKMMERKLIMLLYKIGCYSYMKINPGNGSSIHYAGTIPYSKNPDTLIRVDENNKLASTDFVFIGDSSTWNYLPAKGLTLTMMANATRIASNLASLLKKNN